MGRLAEQDRARHAFGRVERHAGAREDKAKKYRSLVRGLPAMVLQCGLGQTLAFLASKAKGDGDGGESEHAMALGDLRAWLKDWMTRRFPDAKVVDDVLRTLMERDSGTYRMATAEALAYLQWVKRFAEAAIEPPEQE